MLFWPSKPAFLPHSKMYFAVIELFNFTIILWFCTRFYILRKPRSFNVCSKMMSVICDKCSALCCALLGEQHWSWLPNTLTKLIRKAGSAIGSTLDTFEAVVERRSLNKLLSINPVQPWAPSLTDRFSSTATFFSHFIPIYNSCLYPFILLLLLLLLLLGK